MKSLGFLPITLVLEGAVRPGSVMPMMARSCTPTEHMPILGLHSRPPEPMPIVAPDPTRYDRAPIAALVPCYLVDSLRLNSTRRGWPRAREPIARWPWSTPPAVRDPSRR